ncbi:transketolase [Caldicellulosiruptor bescii]|uniref:Transketolase domain protein n=2 Tax=Caldicellulosiruptor bescii TaxID=31899 RepID=B9MLE7_CALBD|nr:transketolase [Caldicellulosiruptor bescii]ACM61137.1 Transketolase domain protein [Caldicellulosiruptor bescii DSM 6725]SKC49271.1 transketolase subunit A [Caldicellulosiruptor bescii]SKC53304.1 transketolase subunit A [Caldicellulosiruptor bescii]SLL38830.1 transketolase subunit A [Caldicellulosiruptor bescii]SMR92433.1 transketolase subunit A [Caldicellulosiruptor bescii]
MDRAKELELKKIATEIRKSIIIQTASAGSGHPGGSLSGVEILTYLYFVEMNIDPKNPKDPNRDRFVLSKGHASPLLYAVLAEKGFISKDELTGFRQIYSNLQGHPDMKKIPGVEMSTGSLGQGLSVANGMALAAKLDGKNYRVYVLLGDGEIQEGQIWEAAMTAAHYKLDNLTAFLDHNGLQIDGKITEVMSPEPVDEKFKAFGWHVIKIDGHDFNQIEKAVNEAKTIKEKPTIIIAETVKGKGVSFMENEAGWHGTAPNKEQAQKALEELQKQLESLEVQG